MNCAEQIDQFLLTGDYDLLFYGWEGQNVVEKAERGSEALTKALLAEVRRRESKVTIPTPRIPDDLAAFTRTKVEPMVRGLFPRKEQGTVLGLLERSVVFLTPSTIEP